MLATTDQTTTDQTTTDQIIGQPLDRVDGKLKVTGHARYAADFPLASVAYACAFQSTIARGRVKSIDDAQARRMPGVLAVITHQNAPRLYRVSMDHNPGKPGQTYLPLQDDHVHYAGQFLGLVVARSFTEARDAAMAVKVEYAEEKPAIDVAENISRAFAPAKMGRADKPDYARGDADAAIASAAIKIDQTFTTSQQNHNPIELSATTAAWDGDKLTLFSATQFVYGSRSIVSTWLGIPEENVRVIDPYVGGGFGCKGSTWPHEVLAAIAAKMVRRPVKFVLSRQQMFSCVGYRPPTIQRIVLAAGGDGKLAAITHDCSSPTSTWRDEWVETATTQTRMLYSCPNVRTSQRLVPLNLNTPTQMRAPGHATGTFALEVAMDELAVAAGIDPVELRLRNYAEKDEKENLPYSSKSLRECYRQGADRFGWNKRNPQVGSMRDGDVLLGWGMATATYPTNQQEANAEIEIKSDGSATVSLAAHDLGTGAYTVLTQIAAEGLGIPVNQVRTKLGDSALPMAPVAGGSQTTASAGSAVKAAAKKAVAAIKERAGADENSPLYQKKARELKVENGRIAVAADPSTGETIADLLRRNGGRPISVKATAGSQAEAESDDEEKESSSSQQPKRFSKHAWGAQFAEVRIDPVLRQIRISRLVGAFAAGKIINPKTAHSQIMGAMVWGVGLAMLEHAEHDPLSGQIVTDNLAEYLVPVNPDIPTIDCFFVEEKDTAVNPLGAKGIGELGITGLAAAVANAVYHATGKRIRDLPVTIEKLLA
jgi:xanthine dehydrogenase YagR molybdenum-binding subunit